MKIKDMPLQNQPRYRLITFGVNALSDAELLAVILQKGTKKENIIEMSNRLLKSNIKEMSLTELQTINGIGEAKAMQVVALFEFAKRQKLPDKKTQITRSQDVYKLMEFLKEKKKEYFYCLSLDVKNNVIERPELISVGILDASLIHPREIFSNAIKKSAKSLILVHNHPSGDVSPSKEDIDITLRLKEAGELLNITILDHVIVGDRWYSFRDDEKL
ncbi:MAG: DNA repair protein RadC [Nanoarchaeota archaeon]